MELTRNEWSVIKMFNDSETEDQAIMAKLSLELLVEKRYEQMKSDGLSNDEINQS